MIDRIENYFYIGINLKQNILLDPPEQGVYFFQGF